MARRGLRWVLEQPAVQRRHVHLREELEAQRVLLQARLDAQRARFEARLLEWLSELEREAKRRGLVHDSGMSPVEAYRLLKLPLGASYPEVRQAWRAQMRIHHPDRVAAHGAEALERAEREAQRLNAAHERLKEHLGATP